VQKTDPTDYLDLDAGREGYVRSQDKFVPVIAVRAGQGSKSTGPQHGIRRQIRAASLLAAAGTIWAVYVGTTDYDSLWRMQIMPPGPVEVCALGILLWLHAKWRRSLL
jgi:hypothetical protein